MYSSYYNYPINSSNNYQNYMSSDGDRIIAGGGFAAPFLLGGLTGALLAPNFYRPFPFYQYPPFFYPPFFYRRRFFY